MPTVTAADFKAQCLSLMDAVQQRGEEILITKRGKPVARLVAVAAPKPAFPFGGMKDSVEVPGDIITPVLTPEEWGVPEELRG